MSDPSDELIAAVQQAALRVVSDSDYECPSEWAIELILRVAHDAGLIVYRDERDRIEAAYAELRQTIGVENRGHGRVTFRIADQDRFAAALRDLTTLLNTDSSFS